ncbi:hypothetical protein CAPTEDRAFT_184900 [Capitella teleta]|uniref:Uncharacterized protein n=1 Tax=Capitella teleta TaxID=283909 RepID=X1ZH79_CAPTE|nr:hypothetical protein CAPTEDRAFT_184900 [Capitella teleta]|eukprot:ELT90116.1 hypothetical protein CAPTEDRAFT_184900 [Capitella teleta]
MPSTPAFERTSSATPTFTYGDYESGSWIDNLTSRSTFLVILIIFMLFTFVAVINAICKKKNQRSGLTGAGQAERTTSSDEVFVTEGSRELSQSSSDTTLDLPPSYFDVMNSLKTYPATKTDDFNCKEYIPEPATDG